MRDNWLSNRIFKSYEDIVALCCQAWNNLIDQPWKIMSLGMRKWAHGWSLINDRWYYTYVEASWTQSLPACLLCALCSSADAAQLTVALDSRGDFAAPSTNVRKD